MREQLWRLVPHQRRIAHAAGAREEHVDQRSRPGRGIVAEQVESLHGGYHAKACTLRPATDEVCMFESRHRQLATRSDFALRMVRVLLVAILIGAGALSIGTAGYCYFAEMGLVDGFFNATMILTGMGPASPEKMCDEGKIFASIYALFSGLVFISLMAIIIGPVAHRMLHRFHLDEQDLEDPPNSQP